MEKDCGLIKYLTIFLLLTFFQTTLLAQVHLPVYDFSQVKPYLEKNNDTIYVVNFWATWCKPCVKELPYIEQLHSDQFVHPVKVLLVSLDFRSQIDTKLVPFLEEQKIKSQVIVLDDTDANSWIDIVDPQWSGAIPATVIYRKNKKEFYGDAFEDYESLKNIVNSF